VVLQVSQKLDDVSISLASVTREQWRAFWAVFLGWLVDAFDFNMLAFILIDIQKSFTVDRALAGALGSITLLMRLLGSAGAGVLADRYGRKLPLMLSILWFSVFAFLSGFSTSYAMLFGLRALFGIGMGGEWTAGMPLVLEHWPARLRGLASGLLQGGWYWGYLLAAVVFEFLYPLFSATADLGWRVMLWAAIVPAMLALWVRRRVKESPVWLERRRFPAGAAPAHMRPAAISLVRIFQRDLIGSTVQTAGLIASFMCIYYAINFWYPTLVRASGHATLPYLAAINVGAILGTAGWGRISETSLGRRGAATLAILLAAAALPLYLYAREPWLMAAGALLMGMFANGLWGIAPAYAAERFPTAVRGIGPGFCYHCGAAVGALMPWLVGRLQDLGTPIAAAIGGAMLVSGAIALTFVWLGPETRGRVFVADTN
jgi:MFS transporter, SHS family, lactate transporter